MSKAPEPASDPHVPAGLVARKVALVVDDEDQLLRLIQRVLENAGFEVLSAMTAEAGLEVFRQHPAEIDVVLLDVQLPDMGAADLVPLLMAEGERLRLILTSGADLPAPLEETMGSIGGRFLRKPFVPKTLLRMLDEAMASGVSRQEEGASSKAESGPVRVAPGSV